MNRNGGGHKGLDFRSSRAVWELHCVERRYRTRGLVLYQGVMATGTVVHEQPGLSPWNSAPPGSIPADLMNWACREGMNRPEEADCPPLSAPRA